MKPVKVCAISGGKGGIGKTNTTINLGYALSKMGQQVMLLDADLSLANIDVLLGLQTQKNLSHVLAGECDLSDIIIDGPSGLKIIPSASGVNEMTKLSVAEYVGLVRAFDELNQQVDMLLIDTAAGISDSVISFSQASQEIIVIVCDEPTSIIDAYAFIKLLSQAYDCQRFKILTNKVATLGEGYHLFNLLLHLTEKLPRDINLHYLGAVPYDAAVRKAIKAQRAVLDMFPESKASHAFQRLANKMAQWPLPDSTTGHVEFFIERLIQSPLYQQGSSL